MTAVAAAAGKHYNYNNILGAFTPIKRVKYSHLRSSRRPCVLRQYAYSFKSVCNVYIINNILHRHCGVSLVIKTPSYRHVYYTVYIGRYLTIIISGRSCVYGLFVICRPTRNLPRAGGHQP